MPLFRDSLTVNALVTTSCTKSIRRLDWWCLACSDLLFKCALGLPKQDSGHWWSSFFFGKQNQPGMGTLTEEAQQKSGVMSVTNGQVTCIAREMVMRQVSESSDGGKSEAGSSPHS
uniref:Pancreatic progenitor cell differentiation and proliferation factor b n=1 Tax=Cyprinus carpio carpio TaxID=630221 RepID=A0A9J8B0P5_CYPCA